MLGACLDRPIHGARSVPTSAWGLRLVAPALDQGGSVWRQNSMRVGASGFPCDKGGYEAQPLLRLPISKTKSWKAKDQSVGTSDPS